MSELPHIDDQVRAIGAAPDRVWPALLAVVAGAFGPLPRPLEAVWRPAQPRLTGDWTNPAVGDTVTGFAVAEIDPGVRLQLSGEHRFSRYELGFTITADGADRSSLCARSCAEFPGILGFGYRTMVITTRLHVLATRRMLGQVAHKAERGR